jgi:hypothetical protein
VEKQALQAEEAGIVIAGNHHDQETLGTLFHARPLGLGDISIF